MKMKEEIVMLPISQIRNTFNILHSVDSEYCAWLRGDIKRHGLQRAIIVNGTKRPKEKDLIEGLQRIVEVRALHKEKATIRFTQSGEIIPRGTIPTVVKCLARLDAWLEAARSNLGRDRTLEKHEFGGHFRRIMADDAKVTQQMIADGAGMSLSWVEQCLYMWDHLDEQMKKSISGGKTKLHSRHLLAVSKVHLQPLQGAFARTLERGNKNEDDAFALANALNRATAGVDVRSLSEQEKDRFVERVERVQADLPVGLRWTNIEQLPFIRDISPPAKITVHSLTRPNCPYKIKYVACPRQTADEPCEKRCKDQRMRLPMEKCSADVTVVALAEVAEEAIKAYAQALAQPHES